MPLYVDAFCLPVPEKNFEAYVKMSKKAGKIWREHGALEYRECFGDDLDVKMGRDFRKGAGAKDGETVVFSWILYKSRKDRDRVNAKVMADPRMAALCGPRDMPFELKKMMYGGFVVKVDV